MDRDKEIKSDRLTRFISDNTLSFGGEGSDLNSNCVILSGFALHCGVDDWFDLVEAIPGVIPNPTAMSELERVYKYAKSNNYGKYWESDEAELMYTF